MIEIWLQWCFEDIFGLTISSPGTYGMTIPVVSEMKSKYSVTLVNPAG